MWPPVSGALDYDPAKWTKPRSAADFDEDSIGLLAVPPPTLDDLARQLHSPFGFLANPDPTEQRIIDDGPASRRLVVQSLGRLPGGHLAGRAIY